MVEFDSKTFDAYMALKAFLERLLGRRVDLVLRDAIKPRLRESVLSEALHYLMRSRSRSTLRSASLRMACRTFGCRILSA